MLAVMPQGLPNFGDALSVAVIVVGTEIGDPNLDKAASVSLCANASGKGMNTSVPPNYG